MTHTQELTQEEAFTFPEHAGLVNPNTRTAYALKIVRGIQETKIVSIDTGPLERIVYSFQTTSKPPQAILLRSAWVRPLEAVDRALPLRVVVKVDHQKTLDQAWKAHQVGGLPVLGPCACNKWNERKICVCPVARLGNLTPDCYLLRGAELSEGMQALPDRPLGVFAPHGSLIEISLLREGPCSAKFQARCGITAALYSTSMQDCGVS